MNKEELSKLKLAELKTMAKSLKVFIGNKNKRELVEAIHQFMTHKNHFMDIDLR